MICVQIVYSTSGQVGEQPAEPQTNGKAEDDDDELDIDAI
jgi:hypothetical protein